MIPFKYLPIFKSSMDAIKSYTNVNRSNASATFGISKMENIYARRNGVLDTPHRHDFYTILLINKAKGNHIIDFNDHILEGNELFFLAPGQVHQLIEEECSIGFSIVFSEEFLIENNIPYHFLEDLNLFNNEGNSSSLKINKEELQQLTQYSEEMLALQNDKSLMFEQAIGAFLKIFLISCNNLCTLNSSNLASSNSNYSTVKAFKNLINDNYTKWHQTTEYANQLNISPDHLNRIVKNHSGKTAKELVQNRIIIASKRLLYFTNLSTKEISFQLGYSEPANFSSFFKKLSGQTPSEFRVKKGIKPKVENK